MTVKIELRDQDVLQVATAEEREKLVGKVRVLAENTHDRDPHDIVEDLLPRALVERVRKIIPNDFQLSEIVIDAEVSGKVLGTGVSGTFSMKLSRKHAGD
jgi:hypothetical protein